MASEMMNALNDKLGEYQDKLTLGNKSGIELPKFFIQNNYGFKNDDFNAYYYTPEYRARHYGFTDPFVPNFKILIDWDKPYGLFADENYVNSATAYLKRIFGEDDIHVILIKKFIDEFKSLIQEFDFLFLNIEGLDDLYTNYNKHQFLEESENKVTINLRETVLMKITNLLQLYDQIWYDQIRGVEILPANLRRFDMYITVFSAGYFNPRLYGKTKISDNNEFDYNDENSIETTRLVLPTIDKFDEIRASGYDPEHIYFNHTMFIMADAQIDMQDSGKKMYSEINNEMSSEYVRNNLTITSRFVGYTGTFRNTLNLGNLTVQDIIALSAAADSADKSNNASFKQMLKNYWNGLVNGAKKQGINSINNITNNVFKTANGLLNPASPIGNALSLVTDTDALTQRLFTPVNAVANALTNRFLDQPANWLQNMVSKNLNTNVLGELGALLGNSIKGTKVAGKESGISLEDWKHIDNSIDFKPNTNFERPDEKIISNQAQYQEIIGSEEYENPSFGNVSVDDSLKTDNTKPSNSAQYQDTIKPYFPENKPQNTNRFSRKGL